MIGEIKETKTELLSESKKVGSLLYLSGQVGIDPETGKMAGDTVQSQTEQIVKNIKGVLAKSGADMGDIVKANCYLTDIDNYEPFNNTYGRHFTSLPVRTCVAVKQLPKQALCEIEVIALLEN